MAHNNLRDTSVLPREERPAYDRNAQLSMGRFRAEASYDGTAYNGFGTQVLPFCGIQDVLEACLSKVFGGRVYVAGCGRTDAGVHARHYVFHFEPPVELFENRKDGKPLAPHLAAAMKAGDQEKVALALEQMCKSHASTSLLPADIHVTNFRPVDTLFHAREMCTGKRYVYSVHEGAGCPLSSRYRWVLGKGKTLDISNMREAAALLIGKHDFSTFGLMVAGDPRSPVKYMRRLDVTRTVTNLSTGDRTIDTPNSSLSRKRSLNGEHCAENILGRGCDDDVESVVTITAECDRFLFNMMRLISGTLVQVGRGLLSVAEFEELFCARGGRPHKGNCQVVKAPAKGLCLHRCFYAEDGPDSVFGP